MTTLKKLLGFIWLLAGPAIVSLLVYGAVLYIDTEGKKDINNPVIWIIIITIFAPIAAGLSLFGWYAIRGEYSRLPEKSSEL